MIKPRQRASRRLRDAREGHRDSAASSGTSARPKRIELERAAELAVASGVLVAASPLMLAAALAVKLDDGGPVFFRQCRYGRDQRPFMMLKFRTMSFGAPSGVHHDFIARLAAGGRSEASGELCKLTDDPRVTRVGRWLRRLSLDELPQLLNVLLGDMAVVGPRPAIPYELEFYEPRHYERFWVRPGLTGLWQVSGRSRLGFLEMLDLDVEYVQRKGLALDLAILARTPMAMVRAAA